LSKFAKEIHEKINFSKNPFGTMNFKHFNELFEELFIKREQIINQSSYNALCEKLKNAYSYNFFKSIKNIISDSSLNIDTIKRSLIYNLRKQQSQLISEQHGDLLSLKRGPHLSHTIDEFSQLDNEIQSKQLAHAVDTHVSSRNNAPKGDERKSIKVADKKEMALIHHIKEKQRCKVKIREMLSRSPVSIRSIKPCVMMSPYSVPAYLDKNIYQFDVLIIDEASQMRVETALSSMIRAKQICVVGDSKQLPPTSVGKAKLKANEDDPEYIDEESILSHCEAVYQNSKRMLKWHYRSQDSSLIAFSNMWFYNNKLLIFPTANEGHVNYGISATYCEDAVYANKTNFIEAEKVVEYAKWHFANRPEDSLVICTMNGPQCDLVNEMMNYYIPSDSVAREYVEKWNQENGGIERFIIKNIEHIQGDERDVVAISTVYGPMTPGGGVAQRFGMIVQKGGERRLNVLLTRAKKAIKLFTSLKPSDIIIEEGKSSLGKKALRAYLEFAFSGNINTTTRAPVKADTDSPFEDQVIEMIESLGCEAVPQVGVSGYFIDIGIKHPKYEYGYLMGVECDGASFHSSLTARERDRLRHGILESKGWHLYRIWSTDWWYQPLEEKAKLKNAISKRLKELNCQ
jgi:superfamily I DNA and/or RNA helicase/very-short-patch-repair endonuclease